MVIALVLISLIASGLSLGWVRHRHKVTFGRSMRSVEGLFDQAHVLCAAAGQEVHLFLRQRDTELQVLILPYLDIPDVAKRTKVHQLIQRYAQDQTFYGVGRMEVDGEQVHELHFSLYPNQGLVSILADSRELLSHGKEQQKPQLELHAIGGSPTFLLNGDRLFLRQQTEKTFPDEYVQKSA